MGIKSVIKEAKKRGWYLERSKNHLIFKHEKGGIVTVPKTGSDIRNCHEVRKNFDRQEIINNH
jgi:predicted RNA binding protein YcfA (HicA-like mRNA interferase family)